MSPTARPKPAASVLSSDLTIQGNVLTSGDIQIEGIVEGDIRAHTLVVGESATVKGEVIAEEVVVHGRVVGRLRGLKVRLSTSARCEGDIVHKTVLLPESQKPVKVPFKVLRGMASIEAIKDRLDVEDASAVDLQAIGAEGIEVSVPLRGSARPVLQEMMKHLCSSISYGGAASLQDLSRRLQADPARYLVKLSGSSRRESYDR